MPLDIMQWVWFFRFGFGFGFCFSFEVLSNIVDSSQKSALSSSYLDPGFFGTLSLL